MEAQAEPLVLAAVLVVLAESNRRHQRAVGRLQAAVVVVVQNRPSRVELVRLVESHSRIWHEYRKTESIRIVIACDRQQAQTQHLGEQQSIDCCSLRFVIDTE